MKKLDMVRHSVNCSFCLRVSSHAANASHSLSTLVKESTNETILSSSNPSNFYLGTIAIFAEYSLVLNHLGDCFK